MTLNGTLEDFSPAGILKVLSADGRTGAVRFGGPSGCTVYLHRGQIYFARSERTDEALATALVRPGRLTADDWGRAIDASGDRPMVGELLVRDGAISPDLLASVVLLAPLVAAGPPGHTVRVGILGTFAPSFDPTTDLVGAFSEGDPSRPRPAAAERHRTRDQGHRHQHGQHQGDPRVRLTHHQHPRRTLPVLRLQLAVHRHGGHGL